MIPLLLKRQLNIFIQTHGGICASRMGDFQQKQAIQKNLARSAADALIMQLQQEQWREFFFGFTTEKGLHENGIIEIFSQYFAKFPDELNEYILREIVEDLRRHWDGTTEAGLGTLNQEAAQRGLDKGQSNSLKAMFKSSRESIWTTGINKLITDLQISIKLENKRKQEMAKQKTDPKHNPISEKKEEKPYFWVSWKFWAEVAAATIVVIGAGIQIIKVIHWPVTPAHPLKEKIEGGSMLAQPDTKALTVMPQQKTPKSLVTTAPANVSSTLAIAELSNGTRTTLTNVLIYDHGASMNSAMLSDGYDLHAIITIGSMASIRQISGQEVEFTFTNGGRKRWKLDGRGITGVDAESLIRTQLMFSDIKTINFVHPN